MGQKLLPVFGRRIACDQLKLAVEMGYIIESGIVGNNRNADESILRVPLAGIHDQD